MECFGYTSIIKGNKEKCGRKTNGILWIIHKNAKIYFCRSSHAVRYLIEQYGRQGSKKKKSQKEEEVDDDNGN